MQPGVERCCTGVERSPHWSPIRPFSSSTACLPKPTCSLVRSRDSRRDPPRPVCCAASSRCNWLQWTCSNLPSGFHKLLATAASLGSLVISPSDNQQCLVSYADGSSNFAPMSDAARLAFATLEQDDDTPIASDAAVDIEALCLLTYSEQGHRFSNSKTALQPSAPASPSTCSWLSDVMVSHSSMGSGTEAEICAGRGKQQWVDGSDDCFDAMSTLCIVTYSEDD